MSDTATQPPMRADLGLVADCWDCGGALEVVHPGRPLNGGRHLRAVVRCAGHCGRAWTVDVSITGHPRVPLREATT